MDTSSITGQSTRSEFHSQGQSVVLQIWEPSTTLTLCDYQSCALLNNVNVAMNRLDSLYHQADIDKWAHGRVAGQSTAPASVFSIKVVQGDLDGLMTERPAVVISDEGGSCKIHTRQADDPVFPSCECVCFVERRCGELLTYPPEKGMSRSTFDWINERGSWSRSSPTRTENLSTTGEPTSSSIRPISRSSPFVQSGWLWIREARSYYGSHERPRSPILSTFSV